MVKTALKPLTKVPHLFDTHCHLDFSEFENSLSNTLAQAWQHGVRDILVPGVTLTQNEALIVKAFPSAIRIHRALGLHPYFMQQHGAGDFDALAQLALHHKEAIVAIGECGIDRAIDDIDKQSALFIAHIELANTLKLPLIVHHRKSHDLIAQAFKQCRPENGGVIHAFSGSYQQAKNYLDKGFKLGIGGTITYPRAKKTIEAVTKLPLSSFVLETDAPSMPLQGRQGEPNQPRYLKEIFNAFNELRGECEEDVRAALYSSSCSLFRI